MSDQTMIKKRRLALTINEKLDIIKDIGKGKKQSEVCRERKLNSSTVATIWRDRDVIKQAVENFSTKCKRIKKATNHDVDEVLFEWYGELTQKEKTTLTGSIMQAKATELGRKIKADANYTCSIGWIDRFKKRHDISFTKCAEGDVEG